MSTIPTRSSAVADAAAAEPQERSRPYAVVGALSLYLNFVNLFLILLRFQGGRRA